MLKGELAFSILILVAATYLFWETGNFVKPGTTMGPSFWPRIVLGCLIVLVGLASVDTLRALETRQAWGQSLATMDRGKLRFFAAIAYLALLPVLGFILTTPAFMIAFMLLLGEKSVGWILGVSIAMTAVIVVLFTKAMYVPLPRGEWLFRQFSLLFY
ncbi:MAG: tripartite tricarboxylate transporter TctB family protein [Candidatus Methylomirabilota bacterium]